jgi:hypothetical protein
MFRAVVFCVILTPLFLALPEIGSAEISVSYTAPEKFRDREFRRESTRRSALAEFDREFARLAARYLPKGLDLRIEVLDIDLAGDFEPWRFGFHDVRILRDTTPPRIRFRYRLSESGVTLRQEEVRLSDMHYLYRARSRYSSERFGHDKQLLEDWFRKTFPAAKAARMGTDSSRPACPFRRGCPNDRDRSSHRDCGGAPIPSAPARGHHKARAHGRGKDRPKAPRDRAGRGSCADPPREKC